MRRSWIVLSLALGAPALAAPDRRPCRPDEPAYAEASRELEALNTAIEALRPDADPTPLIGRAHALAGSRCFALLEDGLSLDTKQALALKAYWEDGGHDHLRSYLDLGKRPTPDLVLPPSLRKTMNEVFPAGHPLASLVCPPAPGSCGAETAGWLLRLQDVIDRASHRPCEREADEPPSDPEQCGAFAAKSTPPARFRRFTECLRAAQPGKKMPPLGRLRVPADGWLTISGRRGHYQFCDELRAFDLTTGASFRVATCSGLVLQRGGSVDNRSTDRARKLEVEVGQVPAAAIRETAWVLMLLEAMRHDGAESVAVALPDNIVPVLRSSDVSKSEVFGCWEGMSSSAQTHLTWRVQRQGQLLAGGGITWPDDYNDAAADHAVSLLRIAEAGFVPGCPPARPPRGIFDEGLSLRANKLDSDAASLRAAGETLTEAWRRAVALSEACPR